MTLCERLERYGHIYGLQRFKGDERHNILLLAGHIVRVDDAWEMTFDTFENFWMLNINGWESNAACLGEKREEESRMKGTVCGEC